MVGVPGFDGAMFELPLEFPGLVGRPWFELPLLFPLPGLEGVCGDPPGRFCEPPDGAALTRTGLLRALESVPMEATIQQKFDSVGATVITVSTFLSAFNAVAARSTR